jgi:hypothetical protein
MNTREHEQHCAEKLVALLVQRHRLPIYVMEVAVARNWKTKFKFYPLPDSLFAVPRRVGRRPGLELDWHTRVGDVDAWQVAGDVASTVLHGWQILRKCLTGRETRPSQLLAIVEKQNAEKQTAEKQNREGSWA